MYVTDEDISLATVHGPYRQPDYHKQNSQRTRIRKRSYGGPDALINLVRELAIQCLHGIMDKTITYITLSTSGIQKQSRCNNSNAV